MFSRREVFSEEGTRTRRVLTQDEMRSRVTSETNPGREPGTQVGLSTHEPGVGGGKTTKTLCQ